MVKYKKQDHSCISRSILWNLDYRGREIKNLKEETEKRKDLRYSVTRNENKIL